MTSKEKPHFLDFVSWGFQAMLLAISAWGVTELSSLSKSVQELNVKMAVVVERDVTRGAEIVEIKHRVDRLEGKD
jgi:hypothetical protein